MPFENLMHDAEQDYFVDGMTGAIISELSKISALKVTSRTTVMRYKDRDLTAPELAKKLGVDAIVEGTVLREGDDIQIYASLIDGREDATLWSASYEEEIESVIKLHRYIALAVARGRRSGSVVLGA